MSKLLELEQQDTSTVELEQQAISFSLEHHLMMNALQLCSKVVSTTGVIPVMKCIKFNINNDMLFLTAMDVDQSILIAIKINNEGNVNGSYLYPAKEGIEIIKRIAAGHIVFTRKESTVYVTYGKKGMASLQTLDSEEFPALPSFKDIEFTKIPIEILRQGSQAFRFAGSDENTPILTGVKIYNDNGYISFISTDRFRMFRYTSGIPLEDNSSEQTQIVISALKFKQIVDAINDVDEVEIAFTKSHFVIRNLGMVYFCRQIDGKFPAISNIINEGMNKGSKLILCRSELEKALRLALAIDAKDNRITLEAIEDEVIISTNSEISELSDTFSDAIVRGDFSEIMFNGKFLEDAMKIVNRDVKRIKIDISGPTNPAFIEYEGEPGLVCVILPVRK